MNIKKLLGLFIAVGTLLIVASPAYAVDHLRLGSQGQLNAKACDKEGKVIINVQEKVLNDVDSGFGGNWAIDNYTRHIKVWKADDDNENQWCAVLKYEGKFETVEGQTGPGGTEVIGANVKGEMRGGYRATFNADLKSSPLWPTHGNVGTIDYGCNITGSTCTYVSWTDQYFDNVTDFDQPWWGWIYRANKQHGVWLNQIDVPAASSGNIL